METDFQQPRMNSGLTRYRSAPSSFLRSLTDREFCDQFFNRPSSPETERIFARFMTGDDDISGGGGGGGGGLEGNQQTQHVNNETRAVHQQQSNVNNYSSVSSNLSFYQSSMKPPLPNPSPVTAKDGSGSMGVDLLPRMRTDGGRNSNLVRQSSSPAGLFNHMNIDGGFAPLGGKGNFGTGSSFKEEVSFSSGSRLKNFSSRPGPPHSSGLISPIAEIENQSMKENKPADNRGFAESRTNDYSTSFPVGSWDESAVMSDNIMSQKALDLEDNDDDDEKAYSNLNLSDAKKMDLGNRPPTLTHHLSLPNTSAEMSAIEKILQFSDSIPCKLRAKRGCATHPRSIAERVRRTKISERMRKLQELVPNMDKQTNTSDMLDLAVEYIKDLQKQVQTLSDNRAKCKCSHGRQQQ